MGKGVLNSRGKNIIWMEFCTKMENDCGLWTRRQFWMGDDERNSWLSREDPVGKRDRLEERGGLHHLQETSWKEVQGVRVWFEKQGIQFQTGSWSKQGSQRGLEMHKMPILSARDQTGTLEVVVFAAPQHFCAVTADTAILRLAFIC